MTKSVYADNSLHSSDINDAWTVLFDLVPAGSAVLDIGCSSGNFGKELIKKKQCTVIGVDIFEDDLALAKKKLTKVYKRNIEADDISDLGMFDVIIMADVIEHLIDPVASLKKVRAQLKPGGRFVFSVPNMANIATRIELLAGRFEYTSYGILDETHLHYYDRIQFETVMRDAGFRVEEYSNTIRDIPRSILKKTLMSMGLEPSEKFFKSAEHVDAITFQFIGYAVAGKLPHAKVKAKAPYDFMSKSFDQQVATSKERLREKEQRLAEAQDTAKRLKKEIDTIYSSKTWHYAKKAHRVVGGVRSALNPKRPR